MFRYKQLYLSFYRYLGRVMCFAPPVFCSQSISISPRHQPKKVKVNPTKKKKSIYRYLFPCLALKPPLSKN